MDVGKLRRWSAVLIASLGLLAVACGGSSSSGSSSSSASTPAPSASAAAALVTTASKTVDGKSQTILVGNKGLTLYYFTPDKGTGKVTCTGTCAQNWPPYTLPSGVTKPTGDKGVTGTLGTIASPGGGMQITYNGWPLYYYFKDADAEDTYGQNVGGKWFVVTPDVASGM